MIVYIICFSIINLLIVLGFMKFSRDISDAIEIEFYKQKSNQQHQINTAYKRIRDLEIQVEYHTHHKGE
jgi:hypothetical protein